jgi:hypothetical protein
MVASVDALRLIGPIHRRTARGIVASSPPTPDADV